MKLVGAIMTLALAPLAHGAPAITIYGMHDADECPSIDMKIIDGDYEQCTSSTCSHLLKGGVTATGGGWLVLWGHAVYINRATGYVMSKNSGDKVFNVHRPGNDINVWNTRIGFVSPNGLLYTWRGCSSQSNKPCKTCQIVENNGANLFPDVVTISGTDRLSECPKDDQLTIEGTYTQCHSSTCKDLINGDVSLDSEGWLILDREPVYRDDGSAYVLAQNKGDNVFNVFGAVSDINDWRIRKGYIGDTNSKLYTWRGCSSQSNKACETCQVTGLFPVGVAPTISIYGMHMADECPSSDMQNIDGVYRKCHQFTCKDLLTGGVETDTHGWLVLRGHAVYRSSNGYVLSKNGGDKVFNVHRPGYDINVWNTRIGYVSPNGLLYTWRGCSSQSNKACTTCQIDESNNADLFL